MAIIKYDGGGKPGGTVKESISYDGGKTWSGGGDSKSGYSYGTGSGGNVISSGTGKAVSGSKQSGGNSSGNTVTTTPSTQTGWQSYAGATGKQYQVADSNGTINVIYTDGTSRLVRPGDTDYNATHQAMQSDLQGNGVSYTPTNTFTNQNGTYTVKDYSRGNEALQYALQQAVKQNGGGSIDTADYVKSLYNRIGAAKADGSGIVTLQDVNNELTRLGLGDYTSDKAIYTAGGNLLPGNEFVKQHTGADGSNSADSLWFSYDGQDYLAGANGGDSSNYAQYVNGKTGNLDNLSFIFGDMQNNPYAREDSDFMAAYNAALNDFNINAGITPTQNIATNAGNTSYTGNANVDSAISYINNLSSYAQQTGNSDLLSQIEALLKNGLTATQDWLAQQKEQAQADAEQQARSAYINNLLAGRAMNETLSAQGLGTSGAMQSAQLGLQNQYNSNINTINQNLGTLFSSLSQQELQALSDYYSNMGQYTYQVTNDEANRALQQAQLALQQQAAYEREYQQQQLAMQQAQWEWQKQQAEREYENTLSQQAYNQKLQQAAYYQDMYNNGLLSDMGLVNSLSNLGLVSSGYWPNGSQTSGATTAQMERQLAAAQLQNQYLANQKLQNSLKKSSGSSSKRSSGASEYPLGNETAAEKQYDIAGLWYTGQPSINPLTQVANYLVGKKQ